MKTLYISILPLFVWLCCACVERPEAIDSFSDVRNIVEYDSLYSDKNDILGAIKDIKIANNTLILQHSGDQYLFSFIDISRGELSARWGRIGRGPNEYLQTGLGVSTLGNRLVFMDDVKKELVQVEIQDILGNNDSVRIQKESFPYTRDFRPRQFVIVGDLRIATGAFKDGRFGAIDSENRILVCPFEYPFEFSEIQGIYRGAVFQSRIQSHEKLDKFIISTPCSDVFEIYEVVGSAIRQTYVSPSANSPQLIRKPRAGVTHTIDYDNSVAGLLNMAVSETLIGLTYCSQNYTRSAQTGNVSDEILCFDWNGNKIKKYILPFPVSNFCIDKTSIYGCRSIDNQTVIYRFKMI